MQRLTEFEKDHIAEFVERLYNKKYRTLPRIKYDKLGVQISLHLFPVYVIIDIYKKNNLYTIRYVKFFNAMQEEALEEFYQFDDIDEVYEFIRYVVLTMKPPKIDY